MTRTEALQMASAAELDLVEVSPTAEPPVVRIMDYGKFLFEQNKKAHSAKRKQKQIQVKEVKFRPRTGDGAPGHRAQAPGSGCHRPRCLQRDRAEPAHGGQADDHGLCTKEEVT